MKNKCKYMKGAEFKARQAWLPFMDATGPAQLSFSFSATLEKVRYAQNC